MAGSPAAVAAELNALSAKGGALHTEANHCTNTRYASDVGRRHFRKSVVKKYLGLNTPQVGRLAIVTAGPPGSGKTTLLHAQVPTLTNYRILDADIVKDYLIDRAISDGIYNHLLSQRLADGHCISPRELAPLVHRESTALIDQMRQICVGRGENVVIEGTLTWSGQGPKYSANWPHRDTPLSKSSVSKPTGQPLTRRHCRDGGRAATLGQRYGSAWRSLHATRFHQHVLFSDSAVSVQRECAQHDQACTIRRDSKRACPDFRS